jgi:hypothetical protein
MSSGRSGTMGSSSRSILLSIIVMFTVLGVQGISSSKVVENGYPLDVTLNWTEGNEVWKDIKVLLGGREGVGKQQRQASQEGEEGAEARGVQLRWGAERRAQAETERDRDRRALDGRDGQVPV